jgi:eukaryotic-like serine/threonine-protein kinase
MPLTVGTKIGPYEIVGQLGAGGMGEVYRARDSKLNRDVALKVLPEAFAADSQRMARFEREAQVLASLNHPNIATIHGLEESGSTKALVMELVEGQTLAERILGPGPATATARPTKGSALPLDEALEIAQQIAEALEYAHERGIIHRDLKPANVKITPEGTVKVLDFGLAKALDPGTGSGVGAIHESPVQISPTMSPTLSIAATQAGMILGTAAYMSPEQARGKAADRRADIWSFGCVLYEMLAGGGLFEGETVSDTLAAVLTREPDWNALPESTPPRIRELVRRCLLKDPKQRLQAIGEARIAIEEAISGAPPLSPLLGEEGSREARGGVASPLSRALPWAIAGLGVALITVLYLWKFAAPARPKSSVLAFVPPPQGTTFRAFGFDAGPVVVSPDGQQLAFSATDQNGTTKLWVRRMDSSEAKSVAGTEDAAAPFWSDDGKSLGFYADARLKTVNLENGNVQVLAEAKCTGGGAWSSDGKILFTPGCGGKLETIPSTGGSPATIPSLNNSSGNEADPAFMPDGQHFLYSSIAQGLRSIWVGSLNSSDGQQILKDAGSPGFASGYLFFIRNGHVFAQSFDPTAWKLAGEAASVAEAQNYSVSSGGVLAFQGGSRRGRLEWFDRSGNSMGVVGPEGFYLSVRISPNGAHVLADVADPTSDTSDLWSYPSSGGVGTRLTFGPGRKVFGTWSPDGKYIAYSCRPNGKRALCRKPSDGSGAEEVISSIDPDIRPQVLDWSSDGRYLSVDEYLMKSAVDKNVIFPLEGNRQPFSASSVSESQYDGLFSPDGHWLAYFSYESGRPEHYVVPFPGPGGKFQISQNGGWAGRWDRKGRLYFLSMGNRMMEADLETTGGSVQVKALKPLFQASLPSAAQPFFDVNADGSRFIVVTSTDPAGTASITVLLNWETKLGTK